MLRIPSILIVASILAAPMRAAPAAEVYKCTAGDGGVAFQDQPCAGDLAQEQVRVVGDAGAPPASAETARAPAPEAPVRPAPEPRLPRGPLPAIWLCTNAEDGSFYVSRNGPPPPRAVPLGVLGFPGKSLAQAFGPGSNVMSAPELARPPIDRSPQSSIASSYTELQDTCVRADASQTCAYLRSQFDATDERLQRARFNDERAKLQGEVDGLREDLEGCGA